MIVHNCKQTDKEWFAIRMGKPSASEFHKILKPSNLCVSDQREKYLYDLCEERLEVRKDFYKSRYMERGQEMEEEARNYYAFDNDLEPQQIGFITDDDERYGCSPDFLIDDSGGGEIKCPKLITHKKYKDSNKLPSTYKLQVLGGLLVTGREWWDFMSYFPGTKPYVFRAYASEYKNELSTLKVALSLFCDDLDKLEKEMKL